MIESVQSYKNQSLLRRSEAHALLSSPQIEASCSARLHKLRPQGFETLLILFNMHGIPMWLDLTSKENHEKDAIEVVENPHGCLSKTNYALFFLFQSLSLSGSNRFFFGMSQGRANEWIHKLSMIVEMALGEAQCLPERDPQNTEMACSSYNFRTILRYSVFE